MRSCSYKQGNRSLISYEVSGTEYGDTCVVFGKLYPELNQAERVYQTMQTLRDGYFAATPELNVPRAGLDSRVVDAGLCLS